jgi:outer membrane protein assembly factor BamB
MLALAFALLLAGPPEKPAPADAWPQWRGPTHDGVAPNAGLPVRWGKDENVVWKTPLPGKGNSTPAVWGDALFVTAQQGDRLLLLRLDRADGKVVWQREVGKGTPGYQGPPGPGRFHNEHNMASPSPVTDGRHVWAHYGNGDLACYDFAGNRVWTFNLTERLGPYTVWWGHANSPCLAGNLLISACMQDPKGGGKSYLVAHDKRTGVEKWRVPRDTGAKAEPADAYTTPLLHRRNGRPELIVFGGNVLDAYDPATGDRLWYCRAFKGNRVISSPTIAGDTVFAVQGMKGPVVAVRAGGTGDVTDTHVRWRYAGPTPDSASPVAAHGLLFLVSNEGMAVCLDGKTGKEQWRQNLGDAFRASPLAAGDRVYFFGKSGTTTVVAAAREFRVIAESELGEATVASPAVAGGDLFVRTEGHLYRIGGKRRAERGAK